MFDVDGLVFRKLAIVVHRAKQSAGRPVEIAVAEARIRKLGDDVREDVLERLTPQEIADAVEVLSGGAFDIRGHRADGAPDPTGVVKGWSVDRAAAILQSLVSHRPG